LCLLFAQFATHAKLEEEIMKWIAPLTVIPMIVLMWFTVKVDAADAPGVPPETVAEYIHAIIETHRDFYATHVVERLEEQEGVKADGEWRTQKKTVPLPVQVINETSQMFATKVTGIRYRLISLWPINRKNGPRDPLDKSGLEAVAARPEQSVSRTVKIDDQTYFRAVYADRAIRQACVTCHNNHPNSPKKDFQIGDIMGGLVIEFPLGK